jgi:hypothetical protein
LKIATLFCIRYCTANSDGLAATNEPHIPDVSLAMAAALDFYALQTFHVKVPQNDTNLFVTLMLSTPMAVAEGTYR